MKTTLSLAAGVMLLLGAPSAKTQEWTRFRGPNGSGVGNATDVPSKWDKPRWKTELPGVGYSSPVLWDDKVFVTSGDAKSGDRLALCINADNGKILWKRSFDSNKYRMHRRNSYASSTPVVEADRVYTAWATPESVEIIALNHNGKTVWTTKLGRFRGNHGFAMSPVLFNDFVILGNDQDGNGSLLALDKDTGKKRWEIPRQGKNATYSTPCVYQRPGRPAELIFTNWQHGITGVDPKTGKVRWELSVFEVNKKERAIASPVVAGELILGTCGFVTAQKHLVAVRPGDPENKVKPREIWRLEKAVAYLPTPLVINDRIFLCSERGVATWLEATTGKVVWQKRIDGEFTASPVYTGKGIFCVSNTGEVVVLAASDDFKLLGRNELGGRVQSTPAIARGCIFFRTRDELICVGERR